MTRFAFLFVGLAWASVTTHAEVATAQTVSEADRQGARELWQQGYKLQQAGQYAEALDKFNRAQAVFSAPTNLLHIAECQAQLGLLVESAETYRGLINLALPANSPAAFTAAQTQGKAELQQVEVRIPKVRIEVTPPNAQQLAVTIDGQPMNVALVGVDRPIDPGSHKIAVSAAGYARDEKVVVINEKDPPKVVPFALQAGGVVVGQPLPPGVGGYPPGTVMYAVPTLQPYAIPAERPYVAPKRDYTSAGFLFGGRIGAAIPTGALNGSTNPNALTGVTGSGGGVATGPGFDLEAYFRFAHKWLVGVYGGHEFYKPPAGDSAGSNEFGASIGVTTNPEGVGFLIDLSIGYRSFSFTGAKVLSNISADGAEGGLGIGLWIAIGKSFRLVPRLDLSAGAFNENGSTNGYAAFFGGVAGYYNFDLGKRPTPAAAATTRLPPDANP